MFSNEDGGSDTTSAKHNFVNSDIESMKSATVRIKRARRTKQARSPVDYKEESEQIKNFPR